MATAKVHKRKANHNYKEGSYFVRTVGWLLRGYITRKHITTVAMHIKRSISWMATAKVHKRKANHNKCNAFACFVWVGWLLRRYINGKPITTQNEASDTRKTLDGYCEGT